MNREQVMKRLTQVFREVFDDDSIELTVTTSAKDIEDWDSLEHINLIAAVEHEFRMRFSMKEVSGMKNVGEMLDILMERAKK
jgi:acyl carrier protein